MMASYLAASRLWLWSPKRGLGLAFGFAGAFIFLLEMAYPLRRALRSRPFGTAKEWLQKHVYWGFLGFLLAALHAGGLPHGAMGWWLIGLTAWVTVSGLAGVLLQKWIPLRLAEQLPVVEVIYERIPATVDDLRAEADALIQGCSERLQDFYYSRIRGPLSAVRPFSLELVLDVRSGRERELEPFRSMARFLEEAEREKIEDLAGLYVQKLELDAHHSNQALLRAWLLWTLHVPAGGLLLGVLLIHVATWIWF
jgi:hypothetical protein